MIKFFPLVILLFIAGCFNQGVITSKFEIPDKTYEVYDSLYGITRVRKIPGKYVVEYRCNSCNRFHTCEVSKEKYDSLIIGKNF